MGSSARAEFAAETKNTYTRKYEGNGLFLLVISGNIEIDGHELGVRDAAAITDFEDVHVQMVERSDLLFVEVLMI